MKRISSLCSSVLALALVSCGETDGEALPVDDAATFSYLMISKNAPDAISSMIELRAALESRAARTLVLPDGECDAEDLELPAACEINTCESDENVVTASIDCDLDEKTYTCSESEYEVGEGSVTLGLTWNQTDGTIEIDADIDAHLKGLLDGHLACLMTATAADDNLSEADFNCSAFQCTLDGDPLQCTDFRLAWKSAAENCE
jgi:hypothetical protein